MTSYSCVHLCPLLKAYWPFCADMYTLQGLMHLHHLFTKWLLMKIEIILYIFIHSSWHKAEILPECNANKSQGTIYTHSHIEELIWSMVWGSGRKSEHPEETLGGEHEQKLHTGSNPSCKGVNLLCHYTALFQIFVTILIKSVLYLWWSHVANQCTFTNYMSVSWTASFMLNSKSVMSNSIFEIKSHVWGNAAQNTAWCSRKLLTVRLNFIFNVLCL